MKSTKIDNYKLEKGSFIFVINIIIQIKSPQIQKITKHLRYTLKNNLNMWDLTFRGIGMI